MIAVLALEDGAWFKGVSAGAAGEARGEVVFNTSMTGYQEVLTDPSYAGQIVTMTCPEIGNYGVASSDSESSRPKVAGFVMRELSRIASNWRAEATLRDYLVANDIVAIADIDTRALTRRLRSGGVLRGVIDWELSGIGAQLLDLGWLLMIADSSIWTAGWQPLHPQPAATIRALYAAESGHDHADVPWYQALANYRLACIACLNVKLHRKGQRHDPIWEHNARSIMPMFKRAQALLAGAG